MHAWEAIQKSLNFIEANIREDIDIEQLSKESALSLFIIKGVMRNYIIIIWRV